MSLLNVVMNQVFGAYWQNLNCKVCLSKKLLTRSLKLMIQVHTWMLSRLHTKQVYVEFYII